MEYSDNIKILLNYRRLKEIKRCNNFSVLHKEDVAQHSFYVALYSLYLAKEYNSNVGKHNMQFHPYDCENTKEVFNVDNVLQCALMHDLEETFTSDIPWNIKHFNEETHEAIQKAVNNKLDGFYSSVNEVHKYIKDRNENAKAGLDGKLVNLVDMLELAIYSSEEVSQGNKTMKPMLDKCVKLIVDMDIYEDMIEFSPTFREIMAMLNSDYDSLNEAYNSLIEIS